jgi:hypothetical protein
MALTAEEKESLMASRGESGRFGESSTKLYRPIVDGKPITMVSVSGMDREQARAYCAGIFGKRFTGFEDE